MPHVRLTTGRLMAFVGLCAIALTGLDFGHQPGKHYPLPGGLRWGVCRNDGFGRAFGPHNGRSGRVYQAGAWRAPTPRDRSGPMRFGLRWRDGIITAWNGGVGAVVW